MFGIYPGGDLVEENNELVFPCSIIIGGFTEPLHFHVSYWAFEDYKSNWIKSLKYGIEKRDHSALAVSMYEPGFTNFIFIWVVYFYGDDAYIQNKMLFLDECPDFTPDSINDFIGEREVHSEDGMKISEWKTDLKSVIDFYHYLKS